MEKRKSIVTGSLVAGVIIAATGFTSNAATMFNHNSLGNGNTVRANLLNGSDAAKTFELKCGADKKKADSTMKKGKDGKCGEGKCGDKKKADSTMKKGKDGKCGADKKDM